MADPYLDRSNTTLQMVYRIDGKNVTSNLTNINGKASTKAILDFAKDFHQFYDYYGKSKGKVSFKLVSKDDIVSE